MYDSYREQARSYRGSACAWVFAMHLRQQRILVFPQLIDSPLELQPILPILVVVLADELRRFRQLLKMHDHVRYIPAQQIPIPRTPARIARLFPVQSLPLAVRIVSGNSDICTNCQPRRRHQIWTTTVSEAEKFYWFVNGDSVVGTEKELMLAISMKNLRAGRNCTCWRRG